MASVCKQCGRPKGPPHHYGKICDLVTLTDGRKVHAKRVAVGGDLHDDLGDELKVAHRDISPEMREQMPTTTKESS